MKSRCIPLLSCVVFAGVLVLTGCTGASSGPSKDQIPQAYIDAINDTLDNTSLSDFQRAVLKDYWVSDDEMQEAKDRFLSCVADKGYAGEFFIRGTQHSAKLSTEDHQKLENEYQDNPMDGLDKEINIVRPCSVKYVDYVAGYYARMRVNPEHKSSAELMRECLQKIGVADKAKSVADDDLQDTITSGKLGTDARNHCSWGAYVDTPMWVSDDAG